MDLIVCIPAYKETIDSIMNVVSSLADACDNKDYAVEVFILINSKSTDVQAIHDEAVDLQQILAHSLSSSNLPFKTYIFNKVMSGKHAGVGMARKLLMDTAFLRFWKMGTKGIIVNLDADTRVGQGYFSALLEYFQNPAHAAASIHFEHELVGDNPEAIIQYELHLRYFINMQRLIGLPYAYQTIGSAMAVTSDAYAKEGGMNMRQAGEDFYFLHKYTSNLGLADITSTMVHPSSRGSDRVPFGTGKAVNDHLAGGVVERLSYDPDSFLVLGRWLSKVETELKCAEAAPILSSCRILNTFLTSIDYSGNLSRVCKTNDYNRRIKAFYAWFNAFLLFKYLHNARDNGRPDLPLSTCLNRLCELIKMKRGETWESDLLSLRKYDRQADYAHQWRAGLISRSWMTTAS